MLLYTLTLVSTNKQDTPHNLGHAYALLEAYRSKDDAIAFVEKNEFQPLAEQKDVYVKKINNVTLYYIINTHILSTESVP
jgi:ribosomal protein S18 acetylase RimI-like enzyme